VNSPPPPSMSRAVYQHVHGEAEEVVPGHVELMNVLWELGIEPDLCSTTIRSADDDN